MAAALRYMSVNLRVFPVVAALCLASCASPLAKPIDPRPQVLYLHTEFLPYGPLEDPNLSNRLNREVIRQALLVAARDGLGVQTCDETLQESPPDDANVIHLMLTERCHDDGKWTVKLSEFTAGKPPAAAKALWEKTYNCNVAADKIYADAIPKLEADSRDALVEALKTAGLRSEKPTVEQPSKEPATAAATAKNDDQKDQVAKVSPGESKDAATPEKFRELLLTPDFVSQFGAVRAAHQAIQTDGETPELLAVLTRGYANLASLTHHHWSSATEVFTARAWLYGQRMAAAKPDDRFALTNRAYAWALGGSCQNATADLDRIEKLPAASDATANKDAAADDSQWLKLLRAFVNCDRDETWLVGKDAGDLKPWGAYLQFELANYARYPSWMYKAAAEVGPTCPMAYKVFDEMAHHGAQLGVIRAGAYAAPSAFAHFVPITIANLPEVPADIRSLLPASATQKGPDAKQTPADPNDPQNPERPFSPLPGTLAEKMREHSRSKLDGDLSWSALAAILEEEQFVQAANFSIVATNATETSLQSMVDALLPLVKNHRFANYIESYSLGSVREPNRLQELFGTMAVRDPRFNMSPMFARIGDVTDSTGHLIGSRLETEATRTFTLPGMVEYYMPVKQSVGRPVEAVLIQANEARAIAPKSPFGTRILVLATPSASSEQLLDWEKTAGDDATTLVALARQHVKLDEKVAAVRCWEKSITAHPTVGAVTELAKFQRDEGNLAKWEETLTGFLQTPSYGLEHSAVQTELAFGFAHLGDWKKAKPFATDAAETYSCRSLMAAAYVYEGLGDWETSERMVQAESTGYPTGNGAEWYFWCCRNGRGDRQNAEKVAEQWFALPNMDERDPMHVVRGIYKASHADLKGARDEFNRTLDSKRTITYTCVSAQLSKELKDTAAANEVIAAMEHELDNPTTERGPEIVTAGKLLLDLVKNGDPTPARVAAIEEALLKINDQHRESAVGWCYVVGNELAAAGNKQDAEKFLRRALIDPRRDTILACLAGMKLAAMNGKARPDNDPLEPKDMWPPLPAK